MKVGIYCGVYAGKVKDLKIDYIGVDQGVEHLLSQGIQPIFAIGDMDSIENKESLKNIPVHEVSSIKDDTDTALAIAYAIQQGYDEIDLYGVTQKRMDHFLAVLCLLERYREYSITIYDQFNKIYVLKPGIHHVMKDHYKYFSVFAFDESIVTLKECHYPLHEYHLLRDDPLCVSNQMMSEEAVIENSGWLIVIQSQ